MNAYTYARDRQTMPDTFQAFSDEFCRQFYESTPMEVLCEPPVFIPSAEQKYNSTPSPKIYDGNQWTPEGIPPYYGDPNRCENGWNIHVNNGDVYAYKRFFREYDKAHGNIYRAPITFVIGPLSRGGADLEEILRAQRSRRGNGSAFHGRPIDEEMPF